MTNEDVTLVDLVMRCGRQFPAPTIGNRERCHVKKIDLTLCPLLTTDAIYRETKGKVKRYQTAGVLGVEMELAALFAFGMAQKVAIGGLLVVTDELTPEGWRPGFFSPRLIKGVRKARKAAVEIVREMV